jgi:hypothetical protein
MNSKDIQVVYKIDYSKPIKVSDFTNSLASLDQQYARYVKRNSLNITDSNIRFYIQEIKKGSIEAVLVPVFSYMMTFPNDTMSIFDYMKSLKDMFDFLQGLATKPPYHFDKADLQHAKNIARPIANDSASQLNVIASDGANVTIHLHVNPVQATEIIEGANKYEKILDQPETVFHENQLLYFRSTEDTYEESKLTRGIIQAISNSPVPVSSPNPDIIATVLENPYGRIFDVNIVVSFVDGKPKQYSIQKINDTFERTRDGQ